MSEPESKPSQTPRRFTKEQRLSRLIDDAVAISDRFAREPVLARTGKGYYKSAGVEGLKEDIAKLKAESDGKPE